MNNRMSLQQVFGLLLFVLLLVGCNAPPATSVAEVPPESPTLEPPAATPTTVPPTETPTTVPPTATPTPVPLTETPTPTLETEIKILVVGNSLTATYEDMGRKGLDLHLEELALSATPPLVIETEAFYEDGATLEIMWDFTKLHELISDGNFDVVVLQGDIPETTIGTFKEYARKFDEEIKESGGKTVLYMTWGYNRLGWISTEEIAQAHRDIATELDIEVAPVGLAFQRALKEQPDLDMFYDQGEHPNLIGSYLAVNVVYATVFGVSPVGLVYLPEDEGGVTVTEEEAAFLQRIAWETVQEYQAQE
jgi:hypothetical protein